MLSKIDIEKSVKNKELLISPYSKINLQSDSYKVHLDDLISIPSGGKINSMSSCDFEKLFKKKKTQGHVLKPGDFILARTREKFSIPKTLSGIMTGKTGLARLGVSITQTAPIVHSGHGIPTPRKIILEVFNAGPFEIVLEKGMHIGKISFFKLETPTDILYDKIGKYGKRKDKDEFYPLKE